MFNRMESSTLTMQVNEIERNVSDVVKGIEFQEKQLRKMKIHCERMLHVVRKRSLLSYVTTVNASLHRFSKLLTEDCSMLEQAVNEEICQLLSVEPMLEYSWSKEDVYPQKMSDIINILLQIESERTSGSQDMSSSAYPSEAKNTEHCSDLVSENTVDDELSSQNKESFPASPLNPEHQMGSSNSMPEEESNIFLTTDEDLVSIMLRKHSISTKVIEPMKIVSSPHTHYTGVWSHASTPLELYVYVISKELIKVQNCERELNLLEMNHSLDTTKGDIQDKPIKIQKQLKEQELGMYALYYYESEKFFLRVYIKDWKFQTEDDLVSVHLLDYGMTMDVRLDKLYPMPEHIAKYPAAAIRCHLSGIIPNNINVDDVKWNESVVDLLRECNIDQERITIEICEDDLDIPESLPVRIMSLTRKVCFNELIKNLQGDFENPKIASHANSEDLPNNPQDGAIPDNWDPMKEDFESSKNTYDFDIDDPAAAIYGYVAKDYKRICRLYAKTGKCFKGDSCTKEHIKYDERGYTTDKEEIYISAFNCLQLPERGGKLWVRILNVLSENEFYCVRDCLKNQETNEETIITLQRYLNQKQNISEMKKLLIPPSVAQIVIAKLPSNNSWCRARVLEVWPEEDACKILFVDYGYIANLSFSDVRAIEPRYLHLPFQAIHCIIHGIAVNPHGQSEISMKILSEISTRRACIKIVSVLPGISARAIVTLFDCDGRNVGERLLMENGGQHFEELVPADSEMVIPG